MAVMSGLAREIASLVERHTPLDPPRHFLDIDQLEIGELRAMLDAGFAYKHGRRDRPLAAKTLAMIFEKPSTRTRVSFEVAMRQLGGDTLYLNAADTQLGRGETLADTANAVLNAEPDWDRIPSDSSPELRRLVRQCLKREANERLDSAESLRVELQRIEGRRRHLSS